MTEEEGARQSPDVNSDKKAFGRDVGKLVFGAGEPGTLRVFLIQWSNRSKVLRRKVGEGRLSIQNENQDFFVRTYDDEGEA